MSIPRPEPDDVMSGASRAAELVRTLRDGEDWLVKQTLHYARCRGFARLAPPLEAAWRHIIQGLTDSLADGLRYHEDAPELEPVLDLAGDPLLRFIVREARTHQERGTELCTFLGLFKYIRQAYSGFLDRHVLAEAHSAELQALLLRSFDRMEVAICQTWQQRSEPALADAAWARSQELLSEKNAYLTVFESLSQPAFLLDEHGTVRNLNHAAVRMLGGMDRPGEAYYGSRKEDPATASAEGQAPESTRARSPIGVPVRQLVPFLPPVESLLQSESPESSSLDVRGLTAQGQRDFQVLISPLLDVSTRQHGAVLIFQDVTERLELEGHLRFLATTDALTGVANRRSLIRRAEHELQRARRYGRPLAMLLLDIDHFKKVNDTWGHFAGDEALKALCSACVDNLRSTDVLGRLGGEEFAVLLPETGIRDACETAERFRQVVERLRVAWHGRTVSMTVSVGVAAFEEGDADIYALMRRADLALYTAKDVGRNRVVLCSDEPSATSAAGDQVEFVLDEV